MAEHKIGIRISELEEDKAVAASVGGAVLAVVKHEGVVRVLDGKCTHEGGPLGEGYVDNGELICPWHSGAFHLDSGAADENTPWVTDIKSYKTRIDAATGEIYIEK